MAGAGGCSGARETRGKLVLDLQLDAAVLSQAVVGSGACDRLRLTETPSAQPTVGDALFDEERLDGRRAPHRQLEVVVVGALCVRVALDRHLEVGVLLQDVRSLLEDR